MITATVSLNVAPLSDNAITAFANAAAWNNYFNSLSGQVTLDAITTTSYTDSPYNDTLTPHQLTVDADVYVFPTLDMFESLRAQVHALDSSYKTLRGALYAAGLISTP